MAVDATMRPLKIPPKFVPYLEEHNIYNLFYDLCSAIVMKKPSDILPFMKAEIRRYRKRLTQPRQIIFIAPPHIALSTLASELSFKCAAEIVTLMDVVLEYKVHQQHQEPYFNPTELAQATSKYLERKGSLNGWILVGFPRTKDEARELQKLGVFPTHTFHIIHRPTEYKKQDLWNEHISTWSYDSFCKMIADYKRRAVGLKQTYQSTIKEVIVRGRTLNEVRDDCMEALLKFPHRGAPLIPRVALIGTRGSRRRTIAKMLTKRYKLVHVHFWDLIARGRTMDNAIGDEIRQVQGYNLHINICLKLLEDRFLDEDCLNHGWVLTGFPNDDLDFRNLDALDTPPNRVIFLKIANEVCLKRLEDRCINMYTGEVMSKKKLGDNRILRNQVATHPQDQREIIVEEQESFSAECPSMAEYKEDKAIMIDADGPLLSVFEKIENVIMNPVAVHPQIHKITVSHSLYVFENENLLNFQDPSYMMLDHSVYQSSDYGFHNLLMNDPQMSILSEKLEISNLVKKRK